MGLLVDCGGVVSWENGLSSHVKGIRQGFVLAALEGRLGLEPETILTDEDGVKVSGRLAGDVLRDALAFRLMEVAAKGFGSALLIVSNEQGRRPTVNILEPRKNEILIETGYDDDDNVLSLFSDSARQLEQLGLDVYEMYYERLASVVWKTAPCPAIRCEWVTEEQERVLADGNIDSFYMAMLSGVPFEDLVV